MSLAFFFVIIGFVKCTNRVIATNIQYVFMYYCFTQMTSSFSSLMADTVNMTTDVSK